MTKVEDIERIRWAHFREGVSVRELARRLHKSRNTIRRALRDAVPWEYRVRPPRPRPVMDPLAPVVEWWLEEDRARPRRQRHTARRFYQRPREEHGLSGGESTVRQWVREQRQTSLAKVTLPLAHDPAAEAQLDFGEAEVEIAGRLGKVQLFCARLAHSTRSTPRPPPRTTPAAWPMRAFGTLPDGLLPISDSDTQRS